VDVLGRRTGDERKRGTAAGETNAELVGPPRLEARPRRERLVETSRSLEVGNTNPDVIDRSRPPLFVMYGFGAIAVRIEQEGAVVAGRVLRPRARRAVVAVAGLGSDPPELVDVLARRRDERDMEPPRHGLLLGRLREREGVPLGAELAAMALLDSDREQNRLVEPLRSRAVRGADRDVVEHVSAGCADRAAARSSARRRLRRAWPESSWRRGPTPSTLRRRGPSPPRSPPRAPRPPFESCPPAGSFP